jgi:hypothetical protein
MIDDAVFCTYCGKNKNGGPPKPSVSNNYPWGNIIAWLPPEIPSALAYSEASEIVTSKTSASGYVSSGRGFLIITNRRIIFVEKRGLLGSHYIVNYVQNIEDLAAASPGKFGLFRDSLLLLDKHGRRRQFVHSGIQKLAPVINQRITQRYGEIEADKERQRTIVTKHIVEIFDFTSLKDIMAKGGVALSTYKCPSCGAGLKIPESGKVFVCEHCGTMITATDVYEKIRAFI